MYSNPGEEDSLEGVKKLKETGGLDLSFKRANSGEIEVDSDCQEDNDEISAIGGNLGTGSNGHNKSSAESGRSRRKPLAPQWLNPTWDELVEQQKKKMAALAQSVDDINESADEQSRDSESAVGASTGRTINGVCVVNDYSMFAKEDKSD